MKAIVQLSFLVDGQTEEDIAALALSLRQSLYLDTLARIEAFGVSAGSLADVLTIFEPSYAAAIDFDEERAA